MEQLLSWAQSDDCQEPPWQGPDHRAPLRWWGHPSKGGDTPQGGVFLQDFHRGRWDGCRQLANPAHHGQHIELQTVDKLLAFKLESDSSLLAQGAGNCAQEQVRREPTLNKKEMHEICWFHSPQQAAGGFSTRRLLLLLAPFFVFFHRGKGNSWCVASISHQGQARLWWWW